MADVITPKAPINIPGVYFFSKLVTNGAAGRFGDTYFSNPEVESVHWAKSGKPEVIHGNGVDPTPYWREIRLLTRDEPSTRRETFGETGPHPYVDYTQTRYMSTDFDAGFLSPPGGFQEEIDNCRAAAVTLAREALNEGTNVQNGADLAEARQTASMLASTGASLIGAYRAARKGNWSGVAKALGVSKADLTNKKTYSDRWLEYQYGWLPLMGSLHDNYEKLRTISATKSLDILGEKTQGRSMTIEGGAGGYYYHWQLEVRSKCSITAELVNEWARDANQWGLLNPFSVAWEVVPFSFVIDWFMPIGTALAAYSATSGLAFRKGYVSTASSETLTITRPGWDNPGHYEVTNFRFDRQVLGDFPMPEVFGKRNPFTNKHIANALGLLYSTGAVSTR